MTKIDLIRQLSETTGYDEAKAERVIDLIFDALRDTLAAGGAVEIRGFGSFAVKEYEGYVGRNPRNGIPMTVPPKKAPTFKVGKELRERIDTIEPRKGEH